MKKFLRLVWFRNDLRIRDNTALFRACQDSQVRIVALFIATPKQWQKHHVSPRQATFIYKNLLKLKTSLLQLNIPFFYYQCSDFNSTINWLKNFCIKKEIKEIFYNKQYEYNELYRDKKLEKILQKNQIKCKSFDDSVLLPPGSIVNVHNKMYKIFTFFYKKFLLKINKINLISFPIPKKRNVENKFKCINNCKIPYFDYLYQKIPKVFKSGEIHALKKLDNFFNITIKNYQKNKDRCDLQVTSYISPYLSIGVLSPRQCLNMLKRSYPSLVEGNALSWLKQLIWREFYRHLMYHYSFLCKNQSFIKWTSKINWENDKNKFFLWKNGNTGYPIIDAAMRQLKKIGWINNRLRMLCANFLVKYLLIDWRLGESYFMSQLLDGDFASNNGGWQWSASTGSNPAPYFRTFNPIIQGKRFDPLGSYVRLWIPELKDVPNKYIHEPQLWDQHNKNLDFYYADPIVDYKKSYQKFLYIYKQARYS